MKLMRLYFSLSMLCLFSCSENQDLLVNQFQIKTIGSLQIGICGHIEAFMTAPGQVFIYTGDNNINTEDNFKTFSGFTSQDLGLIYCNYELAYYDAQNIRIYNLDEQNNFQYEIRLLESNDYAKTFESRTFERIQFNDFITSPGSRYLSKPFFSSSTNGIIASYSYGANSKLDFFTINGNNTSYLSSIAGNYFPVKYKFQGQNGYVLMANFVRESAPIGNNFYLSTTSNGGSTWTVPVLITSTQKLTDFDFNGNTVIAYGNNAAFRSLNKGSAWESINIPFNQGLSSVDIVTEGVAYLSVIFNIDAFGNISKVYKTTNNGSTWEEMDKMVYAGKLSFYDQDHGLAMFRDILQVTHDGAKTWRPVIFPTTP